MEMLQRFFWLLVACLLLTAVHVRAEDDDDDTDDAGLSIKLFVSMFAR